MSCGLSLRGGLVQTGGGGVELQAETREKGALEHAGQSGLRRLGGPDRARPHAYSLMLTVRLAAFFSSKDIRACLALAEEKHPESRTGPTRLGPPAEVKRGACPPPQGRGALVSEGLGQARSLLVALEAQVALGGGARLALHEPVQQVTRLLLQPAQGRLPEPGVRAQRLVGFPLRHVQRPLCVHLPGLPRPRLLQLRRAGLQSRQPAGGGTRRRGAVGAGLRGGQTCPFHAVRQVAKPGLPLRGESSRAVLETRRSTPSPLPRQRWPRATQRWARARASPALPLLQRRLQGAQGRALLHHLVGHLGAVGGGRWAAAPLQGSRRAPPAPLRLDVEQSRLLPPPRKHRL